VTEQVTSVLLGLGLSAACGFRVFVPMMVISLAARTGYLTLSDRFEWIGTPAALLAFTVATVLEIGAYYVPWLDNLLDTVASPAAVVAGIVATASVVTGMDPFMKWTLAIIAGGGLAGTIQLLTAGTRLTSTLATAGIGNPLVASVETASSITLSVLAVLVPIAAALALILLLAFIAGRLLRPRRVP